MQLYHPEGQERAVEQPDEYLNSIDIMIVTLSIGITTKATTL
jgi:hypothetical protein